MRCRANRAVRASCRRSAAGRSNSSTSAAARRRFSRPSSSSGLVDAAERRDVAGTQAEEVTFECEPGTLTAAKLETIRELGVTRLSLGVENFDDEILEVTAGRICRRRSSGPTSGRATLDFPQINIDLIAGMVGETEDNWQRQRRSKTIELDPDSVTIYQMELPFNTTICE